MLLVLVVSAQNTYVMMLVEVYCHGLGLYTIWLRVKQESVKTVGCVCTLLAALFWLQRWVYSDILALSMAVTFIRDFQITRFSQIAQLYAVMFVYDVVGVFGTHTIQTVATGLPLDLPIKLVCPNLTTTGNFVILGLGDVIVPGLACAFARRYDLTRNYRETAAPLTKQLDYSRGTLYKASLKAYAFGLCATFVVFRVTGHAQPALIYILPALVASFALTEGGGNVLSLSE